MLSDFENNVDMCLLYFQYINGTPSLNVVQTQTVQYTNSTERLHTLVLSQNLNRYSTAVVRMRTADDSSSSM